MGTPAKNRKAANLGRYAEDLKNLRQARDDRKQIDAYIRGLEARLKKALGDAEVAEINGVEVITYAKTDSYRWAEFATEHGQIAEKYKVLVQQEILDKDALLRDHASLLQDFRARQFLVK